MSDNESAASTPHPDGFGGARDASILEAYSGWKCGVSDTPAPTSVEVQAVARTRDLLKRAGFKRVATHDFRTVAVRFDEKFNRLQLA